MFRRVISAAGVALVLFHVWLLARQAWQGDLADTGLLLRWLLAAGLIGGLAGLHRSGAPVLWGRKAVVLWLLAAILHGPAAIDITGTVAGPASSEAAPVAAQLVTGALAFGLGLLIVAALLQRARYAPGVWPAAPGGSAASPFIAAGFWSATGARPPPRP